MMTLGEGAVISMSNKQKLNVKISTEGELVGVDDALGKVIRTKLFIEGHGYTVEYNTIYQDNRSTMLLEKMVEVQVERETNISRQDIIWLKTQLIEET